MSNRLIESSVIINAPLSKVWNALIDFDNYHQWNEFTPKIDIEPKIGSTVGLHVRLNPKSNRTILQKEELLVWEDRERLEWGIKDAWYVKTIRVQSLTDLGNGQTKYYTSDAFEGPLTGLILWLYRKKIQIGFDDVCKGLKKYMESN